MTLLLAGIVVLITHALQAATGFGCTVLALPFIAYLLGMKEAVTLLAVLSWVMSAYFAVANWRQIRFKQFLIITALVGAGLPIGMYLFHSLSEIHLKQALAAFIILAAVLEIIKVHRGTGVSPVADTGHGPEADAAKERAPLTGETPVPHEIRLSTQHSALSTLLLPLGGIIHGAFASGGPLVVLYASKALPDKGQFRATLCLLWVALNTVLMVSYARESRYTAAFAREFAAMVPFLLAGILAGEIVHHRVNAVIFRRLIFATLLAVGLVMLVDSLIPR